MKGWFKEIHKSLKYKIFGNGSDDAHQNLKESFKSMHNIQSSKLALENM